MSSSTSTDGLSVLIVEDDENLRAALVALTSREASVCREAETLAKARKLLSTEAFDAVLVDLNMPDGSGQTLLTESEVLGSPEFIIVTGDGSAESAVAALKAGALDYLTKPIDRARLRSVLGNVERTQELKAEVGVLRAQLKDMGCFGSFVGRSEAMQHIYQLIEKVAPTDASVFVTGESGTGKELVAETVHRLSRRRAKPIFAVNCGAMSPTLVESELFGHEKGAFTGADRKREGFFERADGGTLFLDEISEMSLDLQVKLLRVLETGTVTRVGSTDPIKVSVRIIAASNRDPAKAVEAGDLREDLLYRLNVFPIELPPLRKRGGDIQLLAEHFLADVNARDETGKRFTPEALERLPQLPLPGNVRELKNIVERAAILADGAIDVDSLPKAESGSGDIVDEPSRLTVRVGSKLADMERRMILATLDSVDGDKKRAAGILGVSLKTLYNRLNVYAAQDEDPSE